MARERSPNRDKAFEIYKKHGGCITNREIANILNEDEKVIAVWKSRDKWNVNINVVQQSNQSCTTKVKRTKGGQPGNKNAEKFGFFSKYLPEETIDLMQEIKQKDKFDILWEQISIQYAAIIRAQRIMYVKDKEEMIKEIKKEEYTSDGGSKLEYDFQFAWDRQASFLNAQSRAMGELRSLIKQYDNMINSSLELVSEEQKLRIQKLKAEIGKLNSDDLDNELHITIDYGDVILD